MSRLQISVRAVSDRCLAGLADQVDRMADGRLDRGAFLLGRGGKLAVLPVPERRGTAMHPAARVLSGRQPHARRPAQTKFPGECVAPRANREVTGWVTVAQPTSIW